jgi:hypothetical protein
LISLVYGAFSLPPVSKEHEFNKNIPLNVDRSEASGGLFEGVGFLTPYTCFLSLEAIETPIPPSTVLSLDVKWSIQ